MRDGCRDKVFFQLAIIPGSKPVPSNIPITKGERIMVGILWAVVVVLVILWLLGFIVLHVSSFAIHLLLLLAVIVLLYNLFAGSRGAGRL